ncbi:hypothetical protein [Thalassovita aquimarina]|nr:hypothetical protein [Thalassovita aquimarina]
MTPFRLAWWGLTLLVAALFAALLALALIALGHVGLRRWGRL